MILSTHGVLASQIASADPDWVAYYNRVIAAGGSLTTTEQNATKTLVADLKAYGIWSAMKAIYPMVGASAAACAQNLKSSSFTGTFTSGWTFASTGVTPNGTSAYMDTNLNPSTVLGINSTSLGIYSRTEYDDPGFGCDIGARETSSSLLQIITRSGNTAYFDIYCGSGNFSVANSTSLGMFVNTTDATNTKFFRNGSVLLSSANVTKLQPNVNITLSSRSGGIFSSRQLAFAHVGDSLTDTQASNFYTAVQAFQTTLSRQV